MLIPVHADDGLHAPFGTYALMGLCVLMFVVQSAGVDDEARSLYLEFGKVNPIQWFTSAVCHAGILHLLGNLLFLFVFGTIAEGVCGTRVFMGLVAGAMALEGCITQLVMIGTEPEVVREWNSSTGWFETKEIRPAALGASGFIYGLIAASMIWAPHHKVRCVIPWVHDIVEVSALVVAVFYLAGDAFDILVYESDGLISTPWLHLIGAAAGGGLAWVLLKRGVVDTGGWELFGENRNRRTARLHR